MGIAKQILQTDLNYSAWITRRLLDVCSSLTVAEMTRDLGLSHRSVLLTLHHIYDSEQFWVSCLLTNAMPPMSTIGTGEAPPVPTLEELTQLWPPVWDSLDRWFAAVPEDQLAQTLSSRLASGEDFHFTRWQLLRHNVNHATLHRGQIVSMMRMLGKQPPNVDLMSYLLK
jgi:uncharacterized damage-inducible protein DinB